MKKLEAKVQKVLSEMIKEGLVEQVGDKYKLTYKGQIYKKMSVK